VIYRKATNIKVIRRSPHKIKIEIRKKCGRRENRFPTIFGEWNRKYITLSDCKKKLKYNR
jgi:hypothetical protein